MSASNTHQDNSSDATRIVHNDQADATRIAQSSIADSDATRIVRREQPAANKHEAPERYKIGDKIGGRYEVLAIHRGTMGVVYGTFDHTTKLPRALKTLQQRFAGDSKMRDLFAAEALTWVKLEKHPFIVRAYLVDKFDGQPYVITEYIRGQENMGGDLRAWLGHPKLTLPIAVEMALQIAQGMQHAVRKVPCLLHRDLKPANILVNDRVRAMVTDFGLAHAEDAGAGTPAYMAPEQWRLETLDIRTDIYAYGCLLYEMFTGHRMYAARSESEWEAAHLTQMSMVPIAINPSLPPQISAFILRCLSKQIAHRPADWDEVVLECARWFHELTGQPVVLDFSADGLSIDELLTASYSLSSLDKYIEMLEVCDKALACETNNSSQKSAFWGNRGRALKGLNRTEEALSAYDQAIALDRGYKATWLNKGNVLKDLKRYDEAITAYDEALALDPNYALAWHGKSSALQLLGRNEDALSASDQALTIDPNYADYWYNKGNVLFRLKRYKEAISAYDSALAINLSDAGYWYNKGTALLYLKQHKEALTAYDRALAINPSLESAQKNKEFVLQELKHLEEAITAYDRALAIKINQAQHPFQSASTKSVVIWKVILHVMRNWVWYVIGALVVIGYVNIKSTPPS